MPFQTGVMFTATENLPATLAELTKLGFRDGQMAIPGDLDLGGKADAWAPALEAAGFRVHTLFGVYSGESYTDIPTVERTVGFIPRKTRDAREERTLEIIELAAAMKVPGFATHIGFVPEDRLHADYQGVLQVVRTVADAAAKHGITFALETGQETGDALLDFLLEVNRENVGVNFDPANMILYGTGDPILALETVGQHLLTVHGKDGNWPSKDAPGSLGVEMPLGEGAVNFPAFLTVLRKFGYDRPIFIEREAENAAERLRDIASAKAYLAKIDAAV